MLRRIAPYRAGASPGTRSRRSAHPRLSAPYCFWSYCVLLRFWRLTAAQVRGDGGAAGGGRARHLPQAAGLQGPAPARPPGPPGATAALLRRISPCFTLLRLTAPSAPSCSPARASSGPATVPLQPPYCACFALVRRIAPSCRPFKERPLSCRPLKERP